MELSKLGIGLRREVHRVTHLLSWVASGVIFLMMLLTFGDFFWTVRIEASYHR